MPNGNSAERDARADTSAHEGPRDESPGRATADNAMAQGDPVEAALADALTRAAAAGAFEAVAAITTELRARREARLGSWCSTRSVPGARDGGSRETPR
jgi:hypothetical protein